jgi:pimeloyl-ACP methyl ester carboxylesterase
VARGVTADGISRLLMRTRSGLQGVACFDIVSSESSDPGDISVPVKTAVPVDGLFQASSYYRAPESFDAETLRREIEVEFTYTSTIGNGNTTRFRARFDIVRPPVVLLHGLWSSGGAWSTFWQRNTPDFTTEVGDYEATNGASFSDNTEAISELAAAAVAGSREKGYSTTQVDLIGHSMGGLLGRLYAQSADNARPDNLNAGDLRRILTLATPHFGSSFANLVVALHHDDDVQTQETIDSLLGEDIAGGAVCDLAENSPALDAIATTSLPAHAVVATAGPEGTTAQPAEYWGGVFGMKNFEKALTREPCVDRNIFFQCVQREFEFDQTIVDGYRFREDNDAIVPASSARGGLAQANTAEFDVIHFGADLAGLSVVAGPTNEQAVRDHSFALLDASLTDPAWSGSWPPSTADGTGSPASVPGQPGADNPVIYADQCSPGQPLKPATQRQSASRDRTFGRTIDPGIQIVSPIDGSSVPRR